MFSYCEQIWARAKLHVRTLTSIPRFEFRANYPNHFRYHLKYLSDRRPLQNLSSGALQNRPKFVRRCPPYCEEKYWHWKIRHVGHIQLSTSCTPNLEEIGSKMIFALCFLSSVTSDIVAAIVRKEFLINPGVSNRWKSMIGKPINQSISIDKIS